MMDYWEASRVAKPLPPRRRPLQRLHPRPADNEQFNDSLDADFEDLFEDDFEESVVSAPSQSGAEPSFVDPTSRT